MTTARASISPGGWACSSSRVWRRARSSFASASLPWAASWRLNPCLGAARAWRLRFQRKPLDNQPSPIRVLIADDHPMFREGLRLLLEMDARIRVVGEACDGQQAVEL